MPIDSANTCRYCQSTDHRTLLATERMLGLGGDFIYAACATCGSVQLSTIPQDLSPFYPSEYYSLGPLQPSGSARNLLKKIRMRAFLATGHSFFSPRFGGYWLKKLNPKFTDRIADVGCGNGQLLYELSISGFQDLHGFDPFIEKSEVLSPSLTLWKKDLSQTDLCFDLILMHHSFEHMEDPEGMLRLSYERLSPGGRLLVRCPVTDAEQWKTKQELWVQLDAPRHLSIPSTQGFVQAAERTGFTVQEILFDSSGFQFWGTALYEQGERLDRSKLNTHFSAQQLQDWEQLALKYNQEGKGDQACFFCVKPGSTSDAANRA